VRARTFTRSLVAAVVAVYALLVAGATVALGDAAAACRSWPLCSGPLFGVGDALSDPALAVVLGHRALAAVAAGLVLLVAVAAHRRGEPARVRAALWVALALYPLQVALGAASVTGTTSEAVSTLHLVAGTGIFVSLVAGLAWSLEARTASLPSKESEGRGKSEPESDPVEIDGPLALAKAYLSLTKPRLMWLLCLVASAGMALAAESVPAASTVAFTLLGGVLSIGASGTFNHVLEREKDKRMARTADRPLPNHAIPKRNALAFGLLLAAASLLAFWQVNALATALGLAAILFYSVVYTLVLKPNTVQNTVIGGAAGALPALIGSAAVTGTIGLPGLALAGVIFLWTPAHFYNLALAYKDDYAAGGFPMLPVVRGEAVTRKHILYYLGATLVGATALAAVADLGVVYGLTSVALGAVFLYAAVRLHRERTRSAAMRSFHASNAFLGFLLLAVVVDAVAL
jgi:protoheme IX farnesyltransferase